MKSERQVTDDVLAARIARGDVAALEILYDRYAALVLGIALKIVGDRAAAENVLQETFWHVWNHVAADPTERAPFPGRLFRMARQLAMQVRHQPSQHS